MNAGEQFLTPKMMQLMFHALIKVKLTLGILLICHCITERLLLILEVIKSRLLLPFGMCELEVKIGQERHLMVF